MRGPKVEEALGKGKFRRRHREISAIFGSLDGNADPKWASVSLGQLSGWD